MVLVITIACIFVSLFFKTDLGLTLRATGDNAIMSSAQGVDVDTVKIFGISLSNAMVGLSGAAIAQYQGFADIGMGIGMVVNGLAAVIIGEALLKFDNIYSKFSSAAIGSIVFRFMIAFALFAGMNPIDLKLLTAIFVLLTLYVSMKISKNGNKRKKSLTAIFTKRNYIIASIIFIFSVGFYFSGEFATIFKGSDSTRNIKYKIGVVQILSNGLLDVTREAFLVEIEKLGYTKENTQIIQKNANGDIATLNNIIDNFSHEKVDLILTISTPATQAAINKVKDIPVVFATVANPFLVGAGNSDTDHLPNVTGVYGWTPMDKMMELVSKEIGDDITIGTVWDIGQTNSEFNISILKKELQKYSKIKLIEATINNSSEVQQATSSLINKKVQALVLVPDNTVYSAFDAVLKSTNENKIPVFISDVERIKDGAFAAIGYDYSSSGESAAKIIDRILKGENPKDIPFERYTKLTYALNLDVAKKLGKKFSDDVILKANLFVGTKPVKKKLKIGVVQFAMEPNVEICKEGILHALAGHGYKDGDNIEIIYKNANADFPMINSIMQDLISRDVDIIVPLSTPVVQSAVQMVGTRKKPVVVFTYIYDPYRIGAAKSPSDHLPNFTGVACFPPIEKMLDFTKEMFPAKKKIGIVWNSSEANSESVMLKIRVYTKKIGLELIEATVSTPSEVLDATRSVVHRGAQVLLNPGDNTLNVAYDSYAKVAAESKIPLFSVDAELIVNNTIAVLGPDYYRTGFDGGSYLARVLDGEDPAKIPIMQTSQTLLYLNQNNARELKYNIAPEILKRADMIIPDSLAKSSETNVQNLKDNKIAVFLFNENPVLELIYTGVQQTLGQSGIISKNNIKIDRYNAQGDFGNAQLIAKDILRKNYDYILTISTPTLQTMAGVNSKIPHIFGGVTDPYSLGVAKSTTEHQANITGVATFQPVESTIKLMREVFPKAKKIGLVWNSSEACSFACTQIARKAAVKYGFELIEANVSNTSDIQDALSSVIQKGIDIFFTSGDNTVMLSMPQIAEVLKSKKIPYFSNTYSDIDKGTFISLGADYYQVGLEMGKIAEKVLNGENPKSIPIYNYVPEKLNINMALVKAYGLKIPDAIIARYKQNDK
jgi:putative ABC transport system permease protein